MVRTIARELMDEPGVDVGDLSSSFDDIECANRLFGGTRPVLDAVFARPTATLLDVGCGSADIARALLREARARKRSLAIVALDASDAVLAIARERTGLEPALDFVLADGGSLPFADDSFDIATCNLALHHFEPDAAVAMLRELRRVARLTPVVCDLSRSRLAVVAASFFARFIAKSRLSKHDGPLSARRAYTPREAYDLACRAGWQRPVVKRAPFFRMVLVDNA